MTSSLLGIIPASGSGVRARPYSYEMHKGMFSIDGESNISRLISLMRDQFDIEPAVVTGPATDNDVGVDQISERLALPAINALSNGVALGDFVADLLKTKEAA